MGCRSVNVATQQRVEDVQRAIDVQMQREKLRAETLAEDMWALRGETRGMNESLLEMGREMRKAAGEKVDAKMLQMIQATVARTVQETLRESLGAKSSGWVTEEFMTATLRDTPEFSPEFMDTEAATYHAPAKTSTISSHRFRRYKRITTPFGTLLVYYSNETTNWDMYPTSTTPLSRGIKFEAGFTFLPSPALFSRAFTFSFTNLFTTPTHTTTTLTTSLSSFLIIPSSAPIFAYARTGNLAGLRELFTQRLATPNDRDEHGRTPLHWAAALGQLQTCQFLLQTGADASTSNDLARTALHWTTLLSCNTAIIRLLITHGCDPAAPNVAGQSTLFSRGTRSAGFGAVVDAMRSHDAYEVDIDQTDNWGRTPLMWELLNERGEDVDGVRALILRGASVSKRDAMGLTPLHLLVLSCSAERWKVETVVALLAAGADPWAEVEELGGLTVADVARYNGVSEMWSVALKKAGIDGKRKRGEEVRASGVHRESTAKSVRRRTGSWKRAESESAPVPVHKRSLSDIGKAIAKIPRRVQHDLFDNENELKFTVEDAPPSYDALYGTESTAEHRKVEVPYSTESTNLYHTKTPTEGSTFYPTKAPIEGSTFYPPPCPLPKEADAFYPAYSERSDHVPSEASTFYPIPAIDDRPPKEATNFYPTYPAGKPRGVPKESNAFYPTVPSAPAFTENAVTYPAPLQAQQQKQYRVPRQPLVQQAVPYAPPAPPAYHSIADASVFDIVKTGLGRHMGWGVIG